MVILSKSINEEDQSLAEKTIKKYFEFKVIGSFIKFLEPE